MNWFTKYIIPHKDNDHRPHFFREEAVQVVLAILFLLFFISAGSSFIVRSTSLLGNVYTSLLVDLTNKDRIDAGYPGLSVSPVLEKAAAMKANDMVSKGYFAHTSPEGLTPWTWFDQAGYKYLYAGENLAVGFDDSEAVNEGWLNSPTHKANIINSHFTEVGIATAEGFYKGKKTTFVVQLFGAPQKPVLPLVDEPVVEVAKSEDDTPKVEEVTSQQKIEIQLPEPKTIIETTNFALAQASSAPVDPAFRSDLTPAPVYTTGLQRFLLNESRSIQYVFIVFMFFVFVSLSIYLFIEIKSHHYKHIIYGILMLILSISLAFVNHKYFLIS